MNVLLDNFPEYRDGFIGTVSITVISSVIALVLGVAIAGCRVSPVPPLRYFGTAWVTLLRNTPLTLLFLIFFFVVPEILFPGMSPF
ncbi:ABC transporter permease subunit, partial [[Kitasatospora] papulosa]